MKVEKWRNWKFIAENLENTSERFGRTWTNETFAGEVQSMVAENKWLNSFRISGLKDFSLKACLEKSLESSKSLERSKTSKIRRPQKTSKLITRLETIQLSFEG